MERTIGYQQEQIDSLKTGDALFTREDLDKAVNEQVEEYLDKDETQERLTSYARLPIEFRIQRWILSQDK